MGKNFSTVFYSKYFSTRCFINLANFLKKNVLNILLIQPSFVANGSYPARFG